MLSKHMRNDDRLAPVLEKITQQNVRASEIVIGLRFELLAGPAEPGFHSIDLNHLLSERSLTLLRAPDEDLADSRCD